MVFLLTYNPIYGTILYNPKKNRIALDKNTKINLVTVMEMILMLENIQVIGGQLDQTEINAYIDHIQKQYPGQELASLNIEVDDDYVNLTYSFVSVPFERIRRITGYLVGTTNRWNNAKRAEERDRVKHQVSL
jgi:hypothetical protein